MLENELSSGLSQKEFGTHALSIRGKPSDHAFHKLKSEVKSDTNGRSSPTCCRKLPTLAGSHVPRLAQRCQADVSRVYICDQNHWTESVSSKMTEFVTSRVHFQVISGKITGNDEDCTTGACVAGPTVASSARIQEVNGSRSLPAASVLPTRTSISVDTCHAERGLARQHIQDGYQPPRPVRNC